MLRPTFSILIPISNFEKELKLHEEIGAIHSFRDGSDWKLFPPKKSKGCF